MRSLTRQPDGNSQFIESQALRSRYSPQFFGRFTVKRRFGINENVKQTRLVFVIESIQEELNPIGQKFFKLRINRIIDAAQTSDRFAFAGYLQRQTGRAICADHGFSLQRFDLVATVFDPLQLIGARRVLISSSQNRVQVAEPAPLAQVLLRISRAQNARMVDGEFQRHLQLAGNETTFLNYFSNSMPPCATASMMQSSPSRATGAWAEPASFRMYSPARRSPCWS